MTPMELKTSYDLLLRNAASRPKEALIAMKAQADAAGKLAECVRKAIQLANIADDWQLPEVEIDGAMVRTLDLAAEFDAALSAARAAGVKEAQ